MTGAPGGWLLRDIAVECVRSLADDRSLLNASATAGRTVGPLSSEPSGTFELVALLLRNRFPFEAAEGFTRPFEGSVVQFKDTVDGAQGQTSVATPAALLPFVRYPNSLVVFAICSLTEAFAWQRFLRQLAEIVRNRCFAAKIRAREDHLLLA